MRLALVSALALTATAFAEPSEADKQKVAAAIAKGRALEGKTKHAEAIAAYEEALKILPDDELANAELGWAAYQAKDYKRAEAATRLAIAHGKMPEFKRDTRSKPRGAALFNLGLIQEAEKLPDDAAQSYAESLQARPNRVVREKLQKLDRKRAAERDPLAPAKLAGPAKDVRELCRAAMTKMQVDPDEHWGDHSTCTDNADVFKVGKKQLATPFEDVYGYTTVDRTDLELAFKIGGQWYGGRLDGKGRRGTAHCGGTQFVLKRATVTTRGGVPMLQLDYASSGDCSHRDHSWGWEETGTLLVGLNKAPALVPPIVTMQHEWAQADGQKKVDESNASTSIAWTANGDLDIAGSVRNAMTLRGQADPDDLDPEELLGHHVLAFP